MRHAWKVCGSIKHFVSIKLKGRNNFGDLNIDGRIVLRWAIKD
jgi:hypothetical protein